jgi:integrase
MPRLSVKKVEAVRPAGARKEVPDGYVRGLYLIIQPGTGSKSWAVRYRYGGKTRKHTIGNYPTFGLKDARDEAVKVLRTVSEGRDPAQRQRPGNIEDVVAQFLKQRDYRPRSLKQANRLLKRAVDYWRGRRIEEVTRADVRSLLNHIAAPIVANRLHTTLGTLFRWAVENDLIANSPVTGLRAPNKETARDRVLTDDELRAVWQAADRAGYPYGSIVQLLILTGQRRGEVGEMERSEVDLSAGTWTLPRERVKNDRRHEVPLSRQAVAILKNTPRISDRFVFSLNATTPFAGLSKAKGRLNAGIPPWTLHDLRRTTASGMARLGVSLVVIEKVLNHVSGSLAGIVGVYQRHEYAEEKREALQLWADHVERLVGRGERGA